MWLVALGPFLDETSVKPLYVAGYIGAFLAHSIFSIAIIDPCISKPIPCLA